MRFTAVYLLMVGFSIELGVATARAQETIVAHTDFKKEISSAYTFVPHAEAAKEPVPVWSARLVLTETELSAADSQDLVKLAPFEVNGGYRDNGLHAAILRQKADAQTKEVLGKLGIGVYEKKFRKVSVGAATIFWIPVAVGVSW